MDEEQAARWAAAQREVEVGVDLVPLARRQLQFLAAVDRRRWLYEAPLLDRAIRRYKACWLPLLAKHTETAVVEGPLVVPLDCEWIWHCHRLNPVQYIRDCKKVYGRILDNDKIESSTQTKLKDQSEKVWTELYPEEPFDLEYTTSPDIATHVNSEAAEGISYDLVSAVKRQTSFYYQVGTPTMYDQRFLEQALARYKGFLYLIKMNQDKGMQLFRVPTYDVDLMWHTHQLHPITYRNDMLKLLGRVLEHDDTDADRSEGKKLDVGFTGTTEQFESTFGVRYWKAGAMYRGNMPSPVTSIPHVFRGEASSGHHSCEVQKHLYVPGITAVELYLQIVDIKNLPSSIPKESVYVWFTKNQPDMFISDGGRLDISAITGKSIGAGLQCEPTGELVLTLMVDHGSKKPKQIGKVSVPLEELIGRNYYKLSFERWFELKFHGDYAPSSSISLRVAASSTVPSTAQRVLRMTRMEPFSLKTCLLPHSFKDQKTGSWISFVDDWGNELIRLQIREHKAKNGVDFTQELVGVTKSSKKQFRLAEFKENRWALTDSLISIVDDIKPSNGADGCILQLQSDNKMIKIYRGRRLEYQRRCCNHHSEDESAITAVRFTASYPYGKAIALLDTESEFIMVDEGWFLLPWIVVSFLFMDAEGEDGARLLAGTMVQKDVVSGADSIMDPEATTVVAAQVVTAPAKCGTCGTACGGDTVLASDKAGHTSCGTCGTVTAAGGANGRTESAGCGGGCSGGCGNMFKASTKVEPTKSGGCGGGCSGNCGSMVNVSTKAGHVKSGGCGSGCSGNCGGAMVIEGGAKARNVESGGCGSGCGGGCSAVIIEGSKSNAVTSGGCGSGCGGGCGGGCGAVIMEGSKGGTVKSGGCGSGCGSGCGGGCGSGAMVIEGSKGSTVKSGGCGSGCGGGCGGGAMIMERSKGHAVRSGGCGSGCGSGCGGGAMVIEGSKGGNVKSGGCGSGCGGGCGGGAMVLEGSKVTAVKAAGCGSGCGSGCGGGGGCGTMFKESTMAGQAKSGGCGSGCGGGGCGSGCGGMVVEGSSKAVHAKSGGCASGCGGGCGGGGGCGAVLIASTKAAGCGSGCGGGCSSLGKA